MFLKSNKNKISNKRSHEGTSFFLQRDFSGFLVFKRNLKMEGGVKEKMDKLWGGSGQFGWCTPLLSWRKGICESWPGCRPSATFGGTPFFPGGGLSSTRRKEGVGVWGKSVSWAALSRLPPAGVAMF